MTYRLYRLPSPCDDPVNGELIGIYDDFDTALEARDDDAVALLSAAGARPILACHTIVGAGQQGPETPHAITSSLGDNDDTQRDADAIVTETRAWLRHLRRSPSPGAASD